MTGSRSSVFRSVRRPPRRGWIVALKVGLATLAGVAVVAVGLVGALWTEAFVRLGGESVQALADEEVEALGAEGARAPSRATTVLAALVEEHDPVAARQAPLAGPVALVQVSEQREEALVVLLPPDLEVAVDGEGRVPLREVHPDHGLDGLTRSVVDYTGVAVDHAVTASAEALPRLADAFDGVRRCDDAGCRHLDADDVARATLEGDEEARAGAVVDVLRGLAAEVDGTTPLRSPLRTRAVISTLADEVVTDVSLRGARALEVARSLAEPRPVSVVTVPGVVNPDDDRLVVRPEQAAALFQHLQQGTSLEGDAAAHTIDAVAADVALAVHNGAGTAGLASRVESQLQSAGFTVLGTDNAVGFDFEETVVAYGEDDPDAEVAALLIAEQLGGAQLEPRERAPAFRGESVVLVIAGHDLADGEDE